VFIPKVVTGEFLDVFIAEDLAGIFGGKQASIGAEFVDLFILDELQARFIEVFILRELEVAEGSSGASGRVGKQAASFAANMEYHNICVNIMVCLLHGIRMDRRMFGSSLVVTQLVHNPLEAPLWFCSQLAFPDADDAVSERPKGFRN
jgi:hypothetical protein